MKTLINVPADSRVLRTKLELSPLWLCSVERKSILDSSISTLRTPYHH